MTQQISFNYHFDHSLSMNTALYCESYKTFGTSCDREKDLCSLSICHTIMFCNSYTLYITTLFFRE